MGRFVFETPMADSAACKLAVLTAESVDAVTVRENEFQALPNDPDELETSIAKSSQAPRNVGAAMESEGLLTVEGDEITSRVSFIVVQLLQSSTRHSALILPPSNVTVSPTDKTLLNINTRARFSHLHVDDALPVKTNKREQLNLPNGISFILVEELNSTIIAVPSLENRDLEMIGNGDSTGFSTTSKKVFPSMSTEY